MIERSIRKHDTTAIPGYSGRLSDSTVSSVYGPVISWRLGRSLGIDILSVCSICSFNCVYCQLGKIELLTNERSIFVPTAKIKNDILASNWRSADVVTISGSGEPTLALNLDEAIIEARSITEKPIVVLTNSSLLWNRDVRQSIGLADAVFCKLDTWNNDQMERINRPLAAERIESIVEGIVKLRKEFTGKLALQTMLLNTPDRIWVARYSELVRRIRPDEIQLNVPSRPIPKDWCLENRGSKADPDLRSRQLERIGYANILMAADMIEQMTKVRVVTPPTGNRIARMALAI